MLSKIRVPELPVNPLLCVYSFQNIADLEKFLIENYRFKICPLTYAVNFIEKSELSLIRAHYCICLDFFANITFYD